MNTRSIIPLNNILITDIVGGKAASLGKMLNNGITVPHGFVVPANIQSIDSDQLRETLLKAFDELKSSLVAVRSSAVQEDGLNTAWAGQLDTFLNIPRSRLIETIEAVWKSAHSKRAQTYAKHVSASGAGPIATIVQKMVQSELSGIAFSVHPITQSPDHVVIEAGLGLGEAIVSGQITPDTYVTHKHSKNIIDITVSEQDKYLVLNDSGETTWADAGTRGMEQKLHTTHIKQLTASVNQLEQFFGHPVDVEWAIHQGKIYILQSRPITTL